jgi:mannosyltransferase OCH1-like enzyme
MIPKIIWQTYKTKYEDLPKINEVNDLKVLAEYWQSQNPDYKYNYFDDESLAEYILENDSELYECIQECDRIGIGAMKADIFRYFVLYKNGGFYADTDTVCHKPIDSWVDQNNDLILSPEDNSSYFQQWFIGASKNNPILEHVLNKIKQKFKEGIDYSNLHFVHGATGPAIWTESILEYLNIDEKNQLRERSDYYNTLDSLKKSNTFIYSDYRYFRDNTGVVQHLYASINWQNEPNYNNWINNRSNLMRQQ